MSPDVVEVSLSELSVALATKQMTSEAITRAYIDRIHSMDAAGPRLNSVIAINPDALSMARALDSERAAGKVRGALHGVPVLIKDNIETSDPMPTTAGSLALKDNQTGRDTPVVARLRAAGAVILGKANLSEWANIRSNRSTSGWSAVGGLVKNPYALDRNACGSSSGSAVAIAASFAAAAVGTETDGSIVCPASINGVVGMKPTVGLISRTHIVPISHSQDTAGPMARNVRDAAMLLTAMAGSDPLDKMTRDADTHKRDYVAGLSAHALNGMRIGVLRDRAGSHPGTLKQFEASLETLRRGGAQLVDIAESRKDLEGLGEAEFTVLLFEFKAGLDAYLATTPLSVKTRTLADVIAFNIANAQLEMPWFGQEIFEQAQAKGALDSPEYIAALDKAQQLARRKIDALLKEHSVTLLVAPTREPAWLSDPINGDSSRGGASATQLPAVAGYPHLTVPAGTVEGLPVGLSFIGPPWSEQVLLNAGHAFEQLANGRVTPGYKPTLDRGPAADPAK